MHKTVGFEQIMVEYRVFKNHADVYDSVHKFLQCELKLPKVYPMGSTIARFGNVGKLIGTFLLLQGPPKLLLEP